MDKVKTPGIRYTNTQFTFLVILRLLVGWHLLYEGAAKFFQDNWTSKGYLLDSQGILAEFFKNIANQPELMKIIDIANIYGLMAIGVGLMLGVLTRIAAFSGIVLLSLYYLSHPPLIDVKYAMPSEGSYLFVNKNLIEIFVLAIFTVFPTGRLGLDGLIFKQWTRNNG